MKQALSVEQSAELVKRGVNPDKASMSNTTMQAAIGAHGISRIPCQPIFTLTDLLSLLPKELDTTYLLTIVGGYKYWYANYVWNDCYDRDWSKEEELGLFTGEEELIDTLYNLLLWAIDHNHVKLD